MKTKQLNKYLDDFAEILFRLFLVAASLAATFMVVYGQNSPADQRYTLASLDHRSTELFNRQFSVAESFEEPRVQDVEPLAFVRLERRHVKLSPVLYSPKWGRDEDRNAGTHREVVFNKAMFKYNPPTYDGSFTIVKIRLGQ